MTDALTTNAAVTAMRSASVRMKARSGDMAARADCDFPPPLRGRAREGVSHKHRARGTPPPPPPPPPRRGTRGGGGVSHKHRARGTPHPRPLPLLGRGIAYGFALGIAQLGELDS